MRHYAFAAAMGLVTAAILAPGSSSQAATADPTGYWYKPDAERESKIQVFKCGKSQLCAKIIWLKDPNDSKGKPLHDIRNENSSMHDRPIVGLTLFSGMAPSAPGTWTGQIYNPEDGHTYAATLTMLSRTEIKLRGCKAWLLCGEKQWLRTSAPPAAVPAIAPEGTQQIEASATPAQPATAAAVAAATPAAAPKAEVAAVMPAPKAEVAAVTPSMDAATDQAAAMTVAQAPTREAAADPAPQAQETASTQPTAEPVALVSPAPQAGAGDAQKGYGFLNASATSDTAAQYSGENVTSMFKMTSPVATGTVPAPSAAAPAPETAAATPAPAATSARPAAIEASAGGDPVPAPDQKPKAKAHVAAVKSTAKASTGSMTGEQGAPAPAPEDGAMAQADVDPQSAEVDTAIAEPLTRRQRRLLRKQQEPFLPWLR